MANCLRVKKFQLLPLRASQSSVVVTVAPILILSLGGQIWDRSGPATFVVLKIRLNSITFHQLTWMDIEKI
jgi:hypothetical protein